jgi:hypothetical protein
MDIISRATRKQAMISGGYSPGSARNLAEMIENLMVMNGWQNLRNDQQKWFIRMLPSSQKK